MQQRIRTIKPEFFRHGDLYDLESDTGLPMRLAYAGLWTCCDREGRFEWKPRELKAMILPYDPLDFGAVLDALARCGYVVRYEVGGRAYGWVVRFLTHQQVNPRETPPRTPPPPPDVLARLESAALARDFGVAGAASSSGGSNVDASGQHGGSYPPLDDDDDAQPQRRSRKRRSHLTLHDVSRVADASSTREGRVAHSSSSELEGEGKGSGTEGNALTTLPGSPVEPGVAVVVAGAGANAPALPSVRGPRTVDAVASQFATVMAQIATGARTRMTREQLRQVQCDFVITYWAKKTGHTRIILERGDKRERRVLKQLETNGGDVSELLYVVDGSMRDPFLQGKNDNARKYDGIETIFRDRAQVERLAALVPEYGRGEPHKLFVKYERMLRGEDAA